MAKIEFTQTRQELDRREKQVSMTEKEEENVETKFGVEGLSEATNETK
jgi:hypothetical protein